MRQKSEWVGTVGELVVGAGVDGGAVGKLGVLRRRKTCKKKLFIFNSILLTLF